MWRDFKAYLLKQNLLALALAVVIGAATTDVVTSIVDGFIMPVVGLVIPGDWRAFAVTVGPVEFLVGALLSALLHLVIVGLLAWRITLLFIHTEPADPGKPSTADCPFCRQTVDARATRCAYCTSDLAAEAGGRG